MTFQDLPLIPALQRNVASAGYETPTPIQAATIPLAVKGADVLGCAQTGTGKTAAFALPILQKLHAADPGEKRKLRCLILTPTRELALQIYDNFKLKYAIEEGQALTNLTGVIIPYNSQIEIAPISSDISAGISSVEAETETTAPAFNVAGQRVDSSYKGVVIRNGKKLMQK